MVNHYLNVRYYSNTFVHMPGAETVNCLRVKQAVMDGCLWLPEAAKLRKRMKGTKGGRKVWMWVLNIENEDFLAHTELGLKVILKEDINIKQSIEVFLVNYWRCLSICASEGGVGLVWLHGFGALEKPAMVSLSWREPDVSPEQSPGWETFSPGCTKSFVSILARVDSGSWKSTCVKSCSCWSNTPSAFPAYKPEALTLEGTEKGAAGQVIGSASRIHTRSLWYLMSNICSQKFVWATQGVECGSAGDSWGDFLPHDL